MPDAKRDRDSCLDPLDRLDRKMVKLLRHTSSRRRGVQVMRNGFAKSEDIIRHFQRINIKATERHLLDAVNKNNRLELLENVQGLWIRARNSHSRRSVDRELCDMDPEESFKRVRPNSAPSSPYGREGYDSSSDSHDWMQNLTIEQRFDRTIGRQPRPTTATGAPWQAAAPWQGAAAAAAAPPWQGAAAAAAAPPWQGAGPRPPPAKEEPEDQHGPSDMRVDGGSEDTGRHEVVEQMKRLEEEVKILKQEKLEAEASFGRQQVMMLKLQEDNKKLQEEFFKLREEMQAIQAENKKLKEEKEAQLDEPDFDG